VLCPRCRGSVAWSAPGEALDLDPGLIEAGAAAAWYGGVVEVWLRRFKYPGRGIFALRSGPAAVAAELIEVALRGLDAIAPGCFEALDAVVAVPSAIQRVRERGFHPAGNLARVAAASLQRPLVWDALRMTAPRPSQTGLSRAARRRNVAGAFEAAPARVDGAALLLVDDVVTTGATLESVAGALRRGGAEQVWAVCAARAGRVDGPPR
jgi:predicted amidophosphoribosyltransferase